VEPAGFAIGHEFVGEVVETGSAVTGVRPGDRVLVSGVIGCGACPRCARGEVVRCERGGTRVFGVQAELPGGQAEAVAVPAADHAVRRIPEGVSVEQAVLLTDILPTGWFGARFAEVRPGQDVAVIGLGPVGLMALLSAQGMGAARVFAVDPVAERRAVARELGATALSPDQVDAAVAEATRGQGVDAVIEAVGADATIHQAIALARRGGVVSVVGVNMRMDFPFPLGLAFMKDLTFRAGLCPVPETWAELVPLVAAGRLRPERVFTHRMGLSEGAEAYRLFDARRDGVLKVLLDPAG
jgi:2-desacetyl-2-hydroxyethyl bacteriochlorophyllide A dehydrogenase